MAFGWLKKLGKGSVAALSLASALDGQDHSKLDVVAELVEHVEDALGSGNGATKLQKVEQMHDIVIESDLLSFSPEKQARVKAARQRFVNATVEEKNAYTDLVAAWRS